MLTENAETSFSNHAMLRPTAGAQCSSDHEM